MLNRGNNMATSNIDIESELQAVKAITSQLNPLDNDARGRVLDYVFKYLGFPSGASLHTTKQESGATPSIPKRANSLTASESLRVSDIRALKEEKSPRSANEMAAIVAFYLSELVPLEERASSIGVADIQKYFKQAGYPLPKKPSNTLSNAASAGYFDSVGHNQYRLNPVGHNLVAHNLPATTGTSPSRVKRNIAAKKNSSSVRSSSKKKIVSKKATGKNGH